MLNYLRLLFLLLLLFALPSGAQPISGAAAGNIVVTRVGVLPDRAYSWDQIHSDTTLAFRPADSLRSALTRCYWLKLALRNSSSYDVAAQLTVLPKLDNTLFYFDEDARAWRARRAGLLVATDSQQLQGRLPLRLLGHATTTVYVQMRLSQQASLPAAIRLQVKLEKAGGANGAGFLLSAAWVVSLTVLGLLLLTNLSAYARFRDPTALYYCWAQVGGLLYITAFRGYFKVLWPAPVFSLLVQPSGVAYSYSLNAVLMHLSVVLLLLGAVQMTRAYLSTQARLPRLDAALRFALRGYCVFTAVVALVNMSGFYLDGDTLLFDNGLVLAMLVLLLATAGAAYRRQLPLARPYLLANVLPLLCFFLLAGYHVVVGFDNAGNLLLPDLAIVSHALGFSAAISLRLQTAQRTLLATEREAASLALDIRQQELRHREIVLKNSHIQTALLALQQRQQAQHAQAQQLSEDNQQQQAANQDLQAQLEANQRELASTALYVQQKNALLAELKQQLQERPGQQPELVGIKSLLQTSLHLDEDWHRFRRHFEQVHPRFFEELEAQYPTLTSHELRLYSYFHINLSTKEIAVLLNIEPASVRRAKTRLFKKLAAADQLAGRTPLSGELDEPLAGE
jgi:DNA-binding CsgD family transcriptional regulator